MKKAMTVERLNNGLMIKYKSSETGYSKKYVEQILLLQGVLERRLSDMPILELSKEEYKVGVDSFPESYNRIKDEVFHDWLEKRNYELSYSQMCNAFFKALRKLGKLKIGRDLSNDGSEG